MKKLAILLTGFALSALPCTSALADTFGFNFTGTDFSASGTATYVSTATANQFLVTAGSGTLSYNGNSYALSLLPPDVAGNVGFAGNDNLFFAPPNGPFDFNGVGFLVAGLAPRTGLNLFTDTPVGGVRTDFELLGIITGNQLGQESSPLSITLNPTTTTPTPTPGTVTPEPGSLALLGTGALGAFGILRRKFAA